MADPKNPETFLAGNDKPEADKNLTRTGIQKAIAPALAAALASIPGYEAMPEAAKMRRTLRALVTLAIAPMLDAGAPPALVAGQLIEALSHDVSERQDKAEAEAKAQIGEADALDAFPIFDKGNGEAN